MSQFDEPPEIKKGIAHDWFASDPVYRDGTVPFSFRGSDFDDIHNGAKASYPFDADEYYYLTHLKITDQDYTRRRVFPIANHSTGSPKSAPWAADYSRHSVTADRILLWRLPFHYYYKFSSTRVRTNAPTGSLSLNGEMYEVPDGWDSLRTTADVEGAPTARSRLRKEIFYSGSWVDYDARKAWDLKPDKPLWRWVLRGYQNSGSPSEWGYRNVMVCDPCRSIFGGFWQHSETVGQEIIDGLWGVAAGSLRTYLSESASRISGFTQLRGVYLHYGRAQTCTTVLVGPHDGCLNINGIAAILYKDKDWTGQDAYCLMPPKDYNPMAYRPGGKVGTHWTTLRDHPDRGGRTIDASLDYPSYNRAVYRVGFSGTVDPLRNPHMRGRLLVRKNPDEADRWEVWLHRDNHSSMDDEIVGSWEHYAKVADPTVSGTEWFRIVGGIGETLTTKSSAWNAMPRATASTYSRLFGIVNVDTLYKTHLDAQIISNPRSMIGFSGEHSVEAGGRRVFFLPAIFSTPVDYAPLWTLPISHSTQYTLQPYLDPVNLCLIPFPARVGHPLAISLRRPAGFATPSSGDFRNVGALRCGDTTGFTSSLDSGRIGEETLGLLPWLDNDGAVRDQAVYPECSARWRTHASDKMLFAFQGIAVCWEAEAEQIYRWLQVWEDDGGDAADWLSEWDTGFDDGIFDAPAVSPTPQAMSIHRWIRPRPASSALAEAYKYGRYYGQITYVGYGIAAERGDGFMAGYDSGWWDADASVYDPTPPAGSAAYQEAWVDGYNQGWNDYDPFMFPEADFALFDYSFISWAIWFDGWGYMEYADYYNYRYAEAASYRCLVAYQLPSGVETTLDSHSYDYHGLVDIERQRESFGATYFAHHGVFNPGSSFLQWTSGFIYDDNGTDVRNDSDVKAQRFYIYKISKRLEITGPAISSIIPTFSSPITPDSPPTYYHRNFQWHTSWRDYGNYYWPNVRYSVYRVKGVDHSIFPYKPGLISKVVP